jgi:predicted Zn-dependent protease
MRDQVPSRDDLLALAARLVDEARTRGATDAEVFAEYAQQTAIHIEQSDIKGASIDEHRAVGVRVLVGDREGFAYANRNDDEGLREAIDDALAIARASNGDAANGFVEPEPIRAPDGLFDEELLSLAPDACVEHAAAMLARAKEIDARVSADGSFAVSVMRQAVCSSRGVAASGEEAIATYGLHGMAVDGEEVGVVRSRLRGATTARRHCPGRTRRTLRAPGALIAESRRRHVVQGQGRLLG